MALHMQACCRMTKQISKGFRACCGVKKILKCCGKFCWEPRQLSTKQGKMGKYSSHARCAGAWYRLRKQISGDFRACLEKLAEKASNDNAKKQTPLLFFGFARVIL